ncbi:hypothetical protein PSEUDO8Z_60500 [Pseudomonas sp. 8Z]|nr:hypothetical protein PSEUDO8Z_60500 [Pseudomonas sp. 8Z]
MDRIGAIAGVVVRSHALGLSRAATGLPLPKS